MDYHVINNALSSNLNAEQLTCEKKMLDMICLNHMNPKILSKVVVDDDVHEAEAVAKDNEEKNQVSSATKNGARNESSVISTSDNAACKASEGNGAPLFQSESLPTLGTVGTSSIQLDMAKYDPYQPTPPTSPVRLESPFQTPEKPNKSNELVGSPNNYPQTVTLESKLEIVLAQSQEDYKISVLGPPIHIPSPKSNRVVEEVNSSPILPPQNKRRRHDSSGSPFANDSNPRPTKTPKSDQIPVSFKDRHTKLIQPFRSPLLEKSPHSSANTNNQVSRSFTPVFKVPSQPLCGLISSVPEKKVNAHVDSQFTSKCSIKRSYALMKPFKSPLKSPLSSLSASTRNAMSSPNIQAMERKIQLLRRAIKIREVNEEDKLEELTKKWTTAGREVAWELWSAMKDQTPSGEWADEPRTQSSGGPDFGKHHGVFDLNWGFVEENQKQMEREEPSPSPSKLEEEVWKSLRQTTKKPLKMDHDLTISMFQDGSEEKTVDEDAIIDNVNVQAHTLGTMLRSFGVTNEILGWNDEQEDFVDV